MQELMLDPIRQLDAIAGQLELACRFTATTAPEARAWQARTRRALWKCLALDQIEPVPLHPQVVGEVDRGSYLQRKILLQSTAWSHVPFYLLLPKGSGPSGAGPSGAGPSGAGKPRPCVLALHGHGYGVDAIVGISEEGVYREAPGGYQQDFAVQLVKQGFVVAAPEISCFGERETHYHHLPETSPRPSACHNASTYAMMLGLSVPGLRVWDGLRVVDYLAQVPEADTRRLGVMGISGGGMHAFFSACIDKRIKAAVISGYFCNWRRSILAINHCTCNFVPGLLRLGELSDLAGLIAPRPLLVEQGTHDPLFPVAAVRQAVQQARRAWAAFGEAEAVEEDYFEDGHRIHGVVAYPFLQQQLVRKTRVCHGPRVRSGVGADH